MDRILGTYPIQSKQNGGEDSKPSLYQRCQLLGRKRINGDIFLEFNLHVKNKIDLVI